MASSRPRSYTAKPFDGNLNLKYLNDPHTLFFIDPYNMTPLHSLSNSNPTSPCYTLNSDFSNSVIGLRPDKLRAFMMTPILPSSRPADFYS